MYCTSCGGQSSAETQRFCDNCGSILQAPSQSGFAGSPATYDQFLGGNAYGDPGRVTSLNMIQAIKYCFTHYVDGKARGVRSEYWFFYLAYIGFEVIFGIIFPNPGSAGLVRLLLIAWWVPLVTAGVRRMHDVGQSGWMLLVPIYNLVLLCTEGQPSTNRYGNPVDYRGLL